MKSQRQFPTRWFRLYDEIADDPKVQTLSDKLFRFWINCMCLASRNGGYLPPVDKIAWMLRKPETAISAMIAELHERGLLDQEAQTFSPHNWLLRQYTPETPAERMQRYRKKSDVPLRAVTSEGEHVTNVTPEYRIQNTEQSTEQNTEAEQSRVIGFPIQSPRKAHVLDEAFMSFMGEVALTGAPLIEADYEDAHKEWLALDMPDRMRAVSGFKEKREAGMYTDPAMVMRPAKWLKRKEFNRRTVKARDSPDRRERSFVADVAEVIGRNIQETGKPW